jgi:DNA (cytosine-5)-methyltransferase 1
MIGGVDCWEDAAATFERNLATRCYRADLSTVMPAEIERFFGVRARDIDVIAGGPPCQGFSTIGKRDSADPRNRLWTHFLEIVAEIRPAYVLIENVEGLVVMDGGQVRRVIVEAFGRIGYHMVSRLLRASDFGVPQLRKEARHRGRRHI